MRYALEEEEEKKKKKEKKNTEQLSFLKPRPNFDITVSDGWKEVDTVITSSRRVCNTVKYLTALFNGFWFVDTMVEDG